MNKSKIIYLFIVIIISLTGCAKDGATGPSGPQGTAGSNGNANVKSQTSSAIDWLGFGANWYTIIDVPDLTAEVQSNGLVEVFFSTNDGVIWNALPWDGGQLNYKMSFSTWTNHVEIDWMYNNGTGFGTNPDSVFSTTCKFKIVMIPSSHRGTHPNVNWKNYFELKKAFDLNE
jgi:hypothetical protein